jgi:hypothetical protein
VTTGRVALRRSLRRSLLSTGVATAAFVSLLVGAQGLVIEDSAVTPAPVSEQGADRATRLVERRDCWTGEAPAGVVPGHAVVTLPGERAALVPAEVGFGIWLDGDPGRLHAFCR